MKDAHSAKRKVLENLRKEMSSADDGGLKDMLPKMKSKVVVAADNPQDLKKGLDKAKQIMEKRSELMPSSESDLMDEMSDEPESEMEKSLEDVVPELESEEDSEDPAVLKAKIAELKAQLARK